MYYLKSAALSIIFATALTLTTLAEEITTGNLLPNAGDGVDWNSSSTDQINPGSSGYVSNNATMNGFTVTCPTSQSNCGYKKEHSEWADLFLRYCRKMLVRVIGHQKRCRQTPNFLQLVALQL